MTRPERMTEDEFRRIYLGQEPPTSDSLAEATERLRHVTPAEALAQLDREIAASPASRTCPDRRRRHLRQVRDWVLRSQEP